MVPNIDSAKAQQTARDKELDPLQAPKRDNAAWKLRIEGKSLEFSDAVLHAHGATLTLGWEKRSKIRKNFRLWGAMYHSQSQASHKQNEDPDLPQWLR